jgi:hypothetical protein
VIVATYSVHNRQPRILRHVTAPAKWLVRIWAKDGEFRHDSELRNREPCRLNDLLPEATNQIDQILEQNPVYTDAGFIVIKLR